MKSAGWYPDPDNPGIQRWHDGDDWTEARTPVERQRSGPGVLAITAGILLAVLVVWFVYGMAHSNDSLKCSQDNATRSTQGLPTEDCG